MNLLVTLSGSSRYNPIIRLTGGSGRLYTFGWNEEFKAHVWNRGFVSQEDSTDLDDIFSSKDPFYRPSVKIVRGIEDSPVAEQRQEEPILVKKTRRPRKVAA